MRGRPRRRAGGAVTNQQKLFVLLAEIRRCIDDLQLGAAQRKINAIEATLREPLMLVKVPPERALPATRDDEDDDVEDDLDAEVV
jgi:hypothetical protein